MKSRERERRTLIKVVVLGDAQVGKSTLIRRHVTGHYGIETPPGLTHVEAVGVDFMTKTVTHEGVKVQLQIWDTRSNPACFQHLGSTFFRGINAVVFCFDASRPTSFDALDDWHDAFFTRWTRSQSHRRVQLNNMCTVVLACKADLRSPSEEDKEHADIGEGEAPHRGRGGSVFDVDALDFDGVRILDSYPSFQAAAPPTGRLQVPWYTSRLNDWISSRQVTMSAQCSAATGAGLSPQDEEGIFSRITTRVLRSAAGPLVPMSPSSGRQTEEGACTPHNGSPKMQHQQPNSPNFFGTSYAESATNGREEEGRRPGGQTIASSMSMRSVSQLVPFGPKWQKNEDAPKCGACHRTFTLFLRRHHCRRCGRIFCDTCTQSRGTMAEWGYDQPQRQCADCYRTGGRRHLSRPQPAREGRKAWGAHAHSPSHHPTHAQSPSQEAP